MTDSGFLKTTICKTPEETWELGRRIGVSLSGGEVILLRGGLGAGKTLLTKGILEAVGFDPDEVTSPSFSLVNLYHAEKSDVYHIDLWRIDENSDAAFAVGLDEIFDDENAVTIIEWSERLKDTDFGRKTVEIEILGDGDMPRSIKITGL